MGAIQIIRGWFGRAEQRSGPQTPNFSKNNLAWLGNPTDAGINVDDRMAAMHSATFACLAVCNNAFASLPLKVRDGKGNEIRNHRIYRLLNIEPNSEMTASQFRDTVNTNYKLYNEAFAYISFQNGEPDELLPLEYRNCQIMRRNGQLVIVTQIGNRKRVLRQDQVLHIRGGISFDGVTMVSPIDAIRSVVGIGYAAEKYSAKFFGSGGNTGGVLQLPPGMSKDGIANFAQDWKQNYTGVNNTFRTAVLPDGYKYNKLSVDPEQALVTQFELDVLRKVARILRVPLHKVGDPDFSGKGSNIEVQSLEFMENTIQPDATRYEQEIARKLLTEREKAEGYSVRFNLDVLLRADTSSRYDAYLKATGAPILTINEARAKEDLGPVPGGDELVTPLNMGATANLVADTPSADPAARAMPLIEDAERRIATKEANAIKRAVKKYEGDPDGFGIWADEFFGDDHRQLIRSAVDPVAEAFGLELRADYDAERCAAAKQDAIDAFNGKTIEKRNKGFYTD